MKKTFFFFALAAMMLSFTACNKDENEPSGGNGQGGDNTAAMIVGNWLVDQLTYNGQQMPMQVSMTLVMNANGTGEVLENGQSRNNNFTWSVSGNTLTVTPGEESYDFTISNLTATECTLSGNVVPATDMRGDVVMHLTKENGNEPGPGPEPEAFPAGTTWEWSMDSTMTETEESVTYEMSMSVAIRLAFAPTGNNATVTEDMVGTVSVNGVVVPGYGMNEHETLPCTWTYNETTHTGTLHSEMIDPETGEQDIDDLPFTYDATQDVIIIVIPREEPDPDDPEEGEDILPEQIVLHRVNN